MGAFCLLHLPLQPPIAFACLQTQMLSYVQMRKAHEDVPRSFSFSRYSYCATAHLQFSCSRCVQSNIVDTYDQFSHQLAVGALAKDLGEAHIRNLGHVLTQEDVAAPSMPPSAPVTVSWCTVPCCLRPRNARHQTDALLRPCRRSANPRPLQGAQSALQESTPDRGTP